MNKLNTVQKVAKTCQAICFGVLALGVSLMASDMAGVYELPFSNISITTTTFGVLGVIITEIMCKQAANWQD